MEEELGLRTERLDHVRFLREAALQPMSAPSPKSGQLVSCTGSNFKTLLPSFLSSSTKREGRFGEPVQLPRHLLRHCNEQAIRGHDHCG